MRKFKIEILQELANLWKCFIPGKEEISWKFRIIAEINAINKLKLINNN